MAFRACDLVAWGRFVSVCDDNYHRTHILNAEVIVKFAVEDTLIGERHEFLAHGLNVKCWSGQIRT